MNYPLPLQLFKRSTCSRFQKKRNLLRSSHTERDDFDCVWTTHQKWNKVVMDKGLCGPRTYCAHSKLIVDALGLEIPVNLETARFEHSAHL